MRFLHQHTPFGDYLFEIRERALRKGLHWDRFQTEADAQAAALSDEATKTWPVLWPWLKTVGVLWSPTNHFLFSAEFRGCARAFLCAARHGTPLAGLDAASRCAICENILQRVAALATEGIRTGGVAPSGQGRLPAVRRVLVEEDSDEEDSDEEEEEDDDSEGWNTDKN